MSTLLGLVIVGLVATLVWLVTGDTSEDDRLFGLPISALVTAVLAFTFWNYREIRIRLTPRYLDIRYGLLNHKVIPISEIQSCEPTQASFGRYLGIGVRLGRDGSSAYTTSFGPAVEVHSASRRPFVFSSNRAQELSQVINGVLASRQA